MKLCEEWVASGRRLSFEERGVLARELGPVTRIERIQMWVDYVKASPEGYKPNALEAVYHSDGKEILNAVLKKLGWTLAADMIEAHSKDR